MHQPADTGFARRLRIPLRFLVRNRGEQPPFDARRFLGALEQRTILGERRLDAFLKDTGVQARHLGVGKVAVDQALQRAVLFQLGEKRIDLIPQ